MDRDDNDIIEQEQDTHYPPGSDDTARSSTLSQLYLQDRPLVRAGRSATLPSVSVAWRRNNDDDNRQADVCHITEEASNSFYNTSTASSLTPRPGSRGGRAAHPLSASMSTTINPGQDSNASGVPGSRSVSRAGQHTRQESGYQSSTIGTNSIPPMTIGVKRGTDLLASRRGPQITGNHTTPGGSAPPTSGPFYPNSNHNNSQNPISILEVFDYDEYTRRLREFDNKMARGDTPDYKLVFRPDGQPPSQHPRSASASATGQRQHAHSHAGGREYDSQLDDDGHDDEELLSDQDEDNEEEEEEEEDDGIEEAEGYRDDQESNLDLLPLDADPRRGVAQMHSNHKMAQKQQQQQQPFYQLQQQQREEDEIRSPVSPTLSDIRRQVLCSDALAAHNEVLRQTQRDNGANGRGFLNVKNRSNEALGSPFNEQGGNAIAATGGGVLPNTASSVTGNPNAPVVSSRKNSKSRVSPPLSTSKRAGGSNHGGGGGGRSASAAAASATRAGGGGGSSSANHHKRMSTQAFPTLKVDTSMNSSNTTLTGATGATGTGGNNNGNGNGNGRKSASRNETSRSSNNRKPPSSNARYISGAAAAAAGGTAGRGRTTSAASDQSIKKDDLLDRLADALKSERKLVKLYQDELQSAEKEISKVLDAEATRDEEMARLEARHARDKQLISALKLKIERLEAELVRAEDVPHHEAETYLDLLGGTGPRTDKTKTDTSRGGGGGRGHVHRDPTGLLEENDGFVDLDSSEGRDRGNSIIDKGERYYDDNEDPARRQLDDEERSMRGLLEEQDALDGTWTKNMIAKEDHRRKAFAQKRKEFADTMATAKQANSLRDDETTEARLAEAQAMALAQAGLDRRPPLQPQNHTRKLSFKDTLKKTFGLKNVSTDRINITRFATTPLFSVVPASSTESTFSPASTTAAAPPPASVPMMRTFSSPAPTSQLPPIPIDPTLNLKDAKAQNKRLARVALEVDREAMSRDGRGGGLQPPMSAPMGTYGRSASMDVQPMDTPFYTPASMSETALPLSGYSSDSDATAGIKGMGRLFGVGRSAKPPTANATRYGAGITGGPGQQPPNERPRKLSKGSLGRSNSGTAKLGGGFFKHLFPGLDPSTLGTGHDRQSTMLQMPPGQQRWKREGMVNSAGGRQNKTWSQQLPQETAVIRP